MAENLNSLKRVFREYLNLKKLRRTGWQLRGIRDCESLADHCFGVALLTMLIGDSQKKLSLDRGKAVRMALIHEMGECRIGDIPFPALAFLPGKSKAEQEAVTELFSGLGKAGGEYIALFKEYEEAQTPEAKFVKAVDKLEMLITAAEYERSGFRALGDFWENDATFRTFEPFPALAKLANELKRRHLKIK